MSSFVAVTTREETLNNEDDNPVQTDFNKTENDAGTEENSTNPLHVMRNEADERSRLVLKLVSEKDDNVDIIQRCIGVFGRWHIWVCFAIFLCKFPVAWHQLSIVFLAPPPSFTCKDNSDDKCWDQCSEHVFDKTMFTETIITQWDLVCNRAYLEKTAQTITMLGILCGNMLFGFFSDRYGRRFPLIAAIILQVVAGCCAAISPWFALFLIMRFLAATATGGTMITSFVLTMELVGTKWRTPVGIIFQIPFNLGHLIMPLLSYYFRDWRYFQVSISLPSIVLLSYFCVLPESPRWLLSVGKHEKAIEVMEKAAKANHLPVENIRQDVTNYLQKKHSNEEQDLKGGNFLDLFRTPIIRVYTFCIGFNWLVCGLCFFGMAQFMGQLGGNIFVNVALSAVIQIPSTLLSIWFVKAWGRRLTLIIANILAGVSCLAIALVPTDPAWIKTALGCVGMFGLTVSFPTVYIYSGELFPTVVRNIGCGTSSMFARIGSMAAPFVTGLSSVQPWIPPVIFGAVPLIGALLCLKLPETVDCKLPDTVEEAEEFHKTKGRKMNEGTEMTNNSKK